MAAYYNEFEPYAAQWLRNLIKAGHIAPGDVDERSIVDVQASDLIGYSQCHFFAGIGGWSAALQIARWGHERPVWTGSCPCQPFSSAGMRKGRNDERHLWPHWFRLIKECKPPIIFGEQVASAITHRWLDNVANDLEGEGYAIGSSLLPACAVGAPHKRDRLWFVAYSESQRWGDGNDSQLQRQGTGEIDAPTVPSCIGRKLGAGWWAREPDMGRLAHGVLNKVDKIRAYGNAIVPHVAAEFIKAAS